MNLAKIILQQNEIVGKIKRHVYFGILGSEITKGVKQE